MISHGLHHPKATEEELAAAKSKTAKRSKPRDPPCTAAKATAAKPKRAQENPPVAAVAAPGNTPIKSPPKKKLAKKNTDPPAPRRLSFKSPDPDPAKQIGSLQEAWESYHAFFCHDKLTKGVFVLYPHFIRNRCSTIL